MTVTYQVGGGGHLDIDFWVCLVSLSDTLRTLMHTTPAGRLRRSCYAQTHKAVYWNSINNSREGWETRVLLLQPDEHGSGQAREVRFVSLPEHLLAAHDNIASMFTVSYTLTMMVRSDFVTSSIKA